MTAADPLFSTIILLASGVIGLAMAHFARLSPILGFFVIGAVIGPQALGLIDNHSPTIHFLGELGVSFLLFDIGLHLSLKELRKGWRVFFLAGTLQFLFVSTSLAVIIRQLGVPWLASFVLGGIFSLSSTALVLKILSDEKEESSPVGKRATEILVFQDITAILLLVVISGDLTQGVSLVGLAWPILKMTLAAMIGITVGQLALKPLFKILISLKSDEVITAFALLLVFITSWCTQALGLSLAFGAFLGGLALSESSYSYLVRGEVAPFRSLLLSLFFLSVGISLDLQGMVDNIWLLLVLLVLFSAAKAGSNYVAFRLAGIGRDVTVLLSFMLAQGSEFAFVLLAIAASTGVIDERMLGLCISLTGLSLAAAPFLSGVGCMFSRSVCQVNERPDSVDQDSREVIIVRIDEFGRQLASLLDAERIPYRAHDQDLERLAYAKTRGLNVYYSDLKRPRTLGRVSLGKALAVVCLVEDDQVLRTMLEGLRKIEHGLPIIAATENPARLETLNSFGIESAFIKNDSTIIVVFEALIRSLGFDEQRIEESLERALQMLEPEGIFPEAGLGALAEVPAGA